jgi:stress response protein YsnF
LRDQTIEVSERGEEAVVAKDAVVTEEVVVRKTADERVESIDDTVRHTEVDVDDTTTRGRSGKTTGNKRTR